MSKLCFWSCYQENTYCIYSAQKERAVFFGLSLHRNEPLAAQMALVVTTFVLGNGIPPPALTILLSFFEVSLRISNPTVLLSRTSLPDKNEKLAGNGRFEDGSEPDRGSVMAACVITINSKANSFGC